MHKKEYFSIKSKSNQKSNQHWFSAPPTTRTMTHYIVQISSISRIGSLDEECFQRALESWRGTHQLEFCWQPVPCLRCSDGERLVTEFQTGPGDDIIAVRRIAKSRLRWDIGDCNHSAYQPGRMAHGQPPLCALGGQFLVDPLLDRQPVQLRECQRHVIMRAQTVHSSSCMKNCNGASISS